MEETPKKINIAFNGFGRIGRSLVRKLITDDRYKIVAINARSTVDIRAHLFKYDSVHGQFQGGVSYELDSLIINSKKIPNFDRKTPAKLPWGELDVDFVIDSTGKFTNKHDLEQHIEAGAKNVIVTSPANKVQENNIISASSCTTTCLTPILKVIQKNYGIKHGSITTVHSFTMGQTLLDSSHPDLRRARAATMSMIPTSTGAAKNVGLVIPELEGKLDGLAIRVPVPNVSILDISLELDKDITIEKVHDLFTTESKNKMQGIISVSMEPLVSTDYIGNSHSAIVDALSTQVVDKRFLILDLLQYLAEKIKL